MNFITTDNKSQREFKNLKYHTIDNMRTDVMGLFCQVTA